MITFIDFMNKQKLKYNKVLFASDQMYRCKIINQHIRKFRVYCNRYPQMSNDIKKYENIRMEYERIRNKKISTLDECYNFIYFVSNKFIFMSFTIIAIDASIRFIFHI